MSQAGGDEKRAREAAEWLARLNSRSVSREELDAFYAWRRDPDNAAAYARGETLWHESRALGDDREIAEAVREALERPRIEAERMRGIRIGRRTVIGAGVVAVAAAGTGWLLLAQPERYSTKVGEQLLVGLDDGSRVRLNTDSAIEVRFSRERRRVEIVRGEAFFEVRANPERPFEVRTDSLVVRALGTRFNVRQLGADAARVTLAQGRIRVSAPDDGWKRELAGAGETVTFSGSGDPDVSEVDLEAVTSWTGGRLVFRETPLAEAIAEVNRYSAKRIELQAVELADRKVDGMFQTGDPDAFVAAVTALFPLRSRQVSADRIVLTPV